MYVPMYMYTHIYVICMFIRMLSCIMFLIYAPGRLGRTLNQPYTDLAQIQRGNLQKSKTFYIDPK